MPADTRLHQLAGHGQSVWISFFVSRVDTETDRRLAETGRDVVATLEREGIEKFVASVDRLLDGIRAKRDVLTAAA